MLLPFNTGWYNLGGVKEKRTARNPSFRRSGRGGPTEVHQEGAASEIKRKLRKCGAMNPREEEILRREWTLG